MEVYKILGQPAWVLGSIHIADAVSSIDLSGIGSFDWDIDLSVSEVCPLCFYCFPCRHVFHKSCVDPWLSEHCTCPMCKLNILKALGIVVRLELEAGARGGLGGVPSCSTLRCRC